MIIAAWRYTDHHWHANRNGFKLKILLLNLCLPISKLIDGSEILFGFFNITTRHLRLSTLYYPTRTLRNIFPSITCRGSRILPGLFFRIEPDIIHDTYMYTIQCIRSIPVHVQFLILWCFSVFLPQLYWSILTHSTSARLVFIDLTACNS